MIDWRVIAINNGGGRWKSHEIKVIRKENSGSLKGSCSGVVIHPHQALDVQVNAAAHLLSNTLVRFYDIHHKEMEWPILRLNTPRLYGNIINYPCINTLRTEKYKVTSSLILYRKKSFLFFFNFGYLQAPVSWVLSGAARVSNSRSHHAGCGTEETVVRPETAHAKCSLLCRDIHIV